MSAQTTYSFNPVAGAAGGIVDLAPYKIDTFLNKEETGTMKFGYGVIRDSGNICKLPVVTATADKFLGITVNNRTTELDMEGNLYIRNKAAIGVMRYGRIYACTVHGYTVAAGDKLYLVMQGTNAGKFTNAAGAGAIIADTGDISVPVNGVFDGAADANDIASVTLFDAPAIDNDTKYTLPAATSSSLGGVKVGTGLDVAADGTISVHQG